MKEENFTPEQGFETITNVIREAKARFEEDGVIYVMWGILTSFAAFAQYWLLHNGYESINYYPYFLMPIGAIVSAIYSKRKEKGKQTHLGRIISAVWVAASINIMILGFLFAQTLGPVLMPIILILLSIALMISGAIVKSNILLISGILMDLIGIYSFTWDLSEQPLLMGIACVLCVLIPGILLMRNHKKSNV